MSEPTRTRDTGNQSSNLQDYSVSEISVALKKTVEERFGYVRVRGEITGFRGPHSSGHCYFALKDDRARIEAVIWRGSYNRLQHKPEEGLEIVASGKLTTYPGSSKYQIVIDNLEPAGAGALMALLEERKKKLAAEGLFAPERKQVLPFMPKRIGVVTSPTGSVIRDILHRIADRFPLHVIVWPVRVQGETSGGEVARGIAGFNAMPSENRPDVIIVARGGGSIEDLWGFNDEAVVRAAANSHIPLISAVGHETDWTLVDYAADVRAPTPTGAAEITVPVKAELEATLSSLQARLRTALSRKFDQCKSDLRATGRGLSTPDQVLEMPRRRLDEASGRLGRGLEMTIRAKRASFEKSAIGLSGKGLTVLLARNRDRLANAIGRVDTALQNRLVLYKTRYTDIDRRTPAAFSGSFETYKTRVNHASRLLKGFNYESVLARGFSVTRDLDGNLVTKSASVAGGQVLQLQFGDGVRKVVADDEKFTQSAVKNKKSATPGMSEKQGDLF